LLFLLLLLILAKLARFIPNSNSCIRFDSDSDSDINTDTDTNTDTEKKEQEHDVDQKDTTSSDNVTKYKAMSDGKKRQQEEDQNNMNMERIEQRKKQIAASINVVKATATTTAKKRSRETNDKDNVSRNERKNMSKVSTTEHDRSNNNDNDTVNNSNYARPLLQKMRKKRKDHPTTPGQFDDAPDPMLERTSASASSNNTNRITNICAAEAMVTPYFRSQLGNMFDPSGAMNTPLNLNPETRRILRQQLQQQRLEKLEKFWSEQRRQQPLQHLSPLQQQAVAVNAQLEVAVSGLADPYHEQQQRSHQQHLTAAAAAATDKPVALTAAVTQETIDSPHGLALQIRLKTQILKAHMEYNAALLAIDRRNQMQQQQQNQAGNVRINYQPPTNKKQKT